MDKKKAKESPVVPFSKLTTFASSSDKCIQRLGIIFACLAGCVMPSFVFVFGDLIDGFNPAKGSQGILDAIKFVSLVFVFLGIGVFITSYVYFSSMLIFSEKNGLKFRIKYLEAVLNQDATWFEENNP